MSESIPLPAVGFRAELLSRPDVSLARYYVLCSLFSGPLFPIVLLPLLCKYYTLQRWFGLATIAVQTASGSATPEMSIDGILQADQLRDHLYSKMRGARGDQADGQTSKNPEESKNDDQALALLTEIRDSMQALAVQKGAYNEH